MTDNKWMLQFLADVSNLRVTKPRVTQITAFGVAAFAGLGVGLYKDVDDIKGLWQIESQYTPNMDEKLRMEYLKKWRQAVEVAKECK